MAFGGSDFVHSGTPKSHFTHEMRGMAFYYVWNSNPRGFMQARAEREGRAIRSGTANESNPNYFVLGEVFGFVVI